MERRIILVTGLSGAGKTTSMGVLEEMGYYCIDRFPVELIRDFTDVLAINQDIRYRKLALSVSAADFSAFYTLLRNIDSDLRVLFLDADQDQLLLRYKYSRRLHPLLLSNKANSLEEAIGIEREELLKVRDQASVMIDTTFLNQQDLRIKIQELFSDQQTSNFNISFISFGFRYGMPQDADLVFDVRFLKNPYWDKQLRSMNGNDEAVYHYVIDDEKTQEYLAYLTTFLNYTFTEQKKSGKNHLTIAIGCTGGQHRSIAIVNWLYTTYSQNYSCFKDHREIKEVNE